MSNTVIQIKRSQDTSAPVSLANGELAYSFSSDRLFIGQTSNSSVAVSVEYIGGKLIVDKVANLESTVATLEAGSSSHVNVTISNTMYLTNSTNNSVLITKTDGEVDYITGSSGHVLQIASNNTPVFDDLDGGSF